ncbi:MAG: ABC transporter permease [Bacteroidetes bacterium]|nr:ABC transporter permease [Bacteroidota bacterium]
MSVEKFIADKITGSDKDKSNISKPIVKIGIIGIVLGVSVMLLTISIVLGFKKAITDKMTGLTTHLAISNINVNPSNEPEPISISEDTLALLKKINGITHIQRTAFKNGILKTKTENEGILLKGVDREYDFAFLKRHLISGKLPSFTDSSASKDILISEGLASKLELKEGNKMLVYFISQHEAYDSTAKENIIKSEQRSRKLVICGIFKTGFADFDDHLTFVDLRQIRVLNYWKPEQAGNYEIMIDDFGKLEYTKEQISDLLGYSYNVNTIKEIYANIFIWLDKLDINGIIIIVLMILVAVINMITALLILILERTNMVGLVKSLGMSNASVRKIFMFISIRLIGKGLLWGNVVGIGLCYLQYYFKLIKLDSATYYVDYVAIDINWLYFLILNAGTFLICILMLFLPTILISKLTPIKTLRFD